MPALYPVSSWIPEDDLMLKNAVEAGASLEALAKGAVQFSRCFSIQELQNRWHALLYDPETSGPASAHMFELEVSSSNISPQSGKVGCEVNVVSGKRKNESIRSRYYSMRKRICNEPFSNIDLSFLAVSTPHHCEEQVMNHDEQPVKNYVNGDPLEVDFDLHDANFDELGHGFSHIMRVDVSMENDVGIAQTCASKHNDSLEGEIPDGILSRYCLYEFEENIPPASVNEVMGSKIPYSLEHGNLHSDIAVLEENFSAFETIPGVQEIRTPGVPPGESLLGTSNPETKPLGEFDVVNDNPVSICSGFGQNQDFSSLVSDCGAKFHQLEYSSLHDTVPIWRTMVDMSAPSILNNENLSAKDRAAGDPTAYQVTDSKQGCPSDYNVVHSNPQLEDSMSGDGLNCPTTISGDFSIFPSPSWNLQNDEELLLMDVDGTDMIDSACLDGLNSIFNSPNEIHQNDITSFTESKVSASMDAHMMNPGVCSGEYALNDDKLQYGYRTSDTSTNVPSLTLTPNPHSPECPDRVICCVLNTEDPDIPSNDDVCLPNDVGPSFTSSGPQHIFEKDGKLFPLATADFSHTQMRGEQGSNHAKEELFSNSQVIEAQYVPEISSENPLPCGVMSELPENVSLEMTYRLVGVPKVDPNQCASTQLTPYSICAAELPEDTAEVESGKHCNFDNSGSCLLENSANCSGDSEYHQNNMINDYNYESNITGAIQVDASAEHGPSEFPITEPGLNPSVLDQEIQSSEDDCDVPNFSDIEALILDMDLDPCDQNYFNKEVSRYQHEKAQRAILRLEQGAHSYMQRSITSHKAFAVLYGRRLKHYIRKPEVSLGRETNGDTVDIDLAKEGRANKISRHQATIKMEEDGTFSLKNFGRGSVVINGKEVASGRCIRLFSGCVIEIRCISFIFEINQKAVEHFLTNICKMNDDDGGSKFERVVS